MRFKVIIVIVVTFLCSCKKEKEEHEILVFPNCKLIREELQTTYGISEARTYLYDSDKLIQTDFYANDKFNSTKTFEYDLENNMAYMLTHNSLIEETDTIASFRFQDKLLVEFKHFDTSNNSVFHTTTYEYKNGFLSRIITINKENQMIISVSTDKYGNPKEMSIIEINGESPKQEIKEYCEYDNSFNPYYGLLDFIETRYFSQNNMISSKTFIDGVEQNGTIISFEYDENNLPVKSIEGEHTTLYVYECQ